MLSIEKRETTPSEKARWPADRRLRLNTHETIPDCRREALMRILTTPENCGALVGREDADRPGFFDFHHEGWLYFVYIYPSRKRAKLLKAWRLREAPPG